MGNELEPIYAANLAANVYDIKSSITREDFLEEYKLDMVISKAKLATGITGGYILNKPHVMAIFSAGKGAYKGQAFVAFKGTASLYDALTDLNVGIRACHSGTYVHQGFFYAFESILIELQQFISGLQGVTTVHSRQRLQGLSQNRSCSRGTHMAICSCACLQRGLSAVFPGISGALGIPFHEALH